MNEVYSVAMDLTFFHEAWGEVYETYGTQLYLCIPIHRHPGIRKSR